METANSLSQLGSFEPHGQCFLWNSDLVLLHTISDSITALAYYSIPIALLYFVKKRQDLPYKWIFVLFGAFILACGTTHLMAVWTIWKPDYWLEGTIKGVTAATSLVAAGLLWPIMPRLLRLPSPAQLDAANQELQKEIVVRKRAEAELSAAGQDLERQVRERTVELVQANQALHADVTKRLRAEEALQKAETQYRLLLSSTDEGIYGVNADGLCEFINRAAAEMLGYSPKDCLGKDMHMLIHHSRLDGSPYPVEECPVSNAFRNGQGIRTTGEVLWRHDRTPFPAEYSSFPVIENGGRRGAVVTFTDITQRKQAEDRLSKSEKQFRLLAETITEVFWMTDVAIEKIFYISPAYEQIWGRTCESLYQAPHSFLDAIHPKDRQQVTADILAWQAAEKPYDHEYRIIRPDGSIRWILDRGFPVHDHAGRVIQYVGVAKDITERKRTEEALREANNHNRTLIEAGLDPLAAISPDGKITDVNTAAEAITGLPRERLIGSDFWTYFTEPDKAREVYPQVLAQGTMRDYPLTIRHTSGRLMDVLYNATVYCDNEGAVQGVLATARDITERKRMLEQAARVERLATLGQLLSGIAHEIKNPLFVMTGRVQLLKEKLSNREYDTLAQDISIIENTGKRMTEITQRFLSLARPLKPQWQKCLVHDVLAQTLDFLANELMKNRINVVRSDAPDLPPTRSEPRQLHEVFLNIVMNAMQAMTAAHGQGTLTITTLRKDDWIETRILDDGPGIPLPHRARLFEPFFSTKPPEQGTGLGLWTVRSILTELNGTVECESVEGQGTTFIVRIPIVSYPPKE